jgi:hypothetical protein
MAAERVLEAHGRDEQLHVEHRDLEGFTGLISRTAKVLPTKGAQRIIHGMRRTLDETPILTRPQDAQ